MSTVNIGNIPVGKGHPCFILAEAGCNHNQRLDLAKDLIDMAATSRADGVKFQSYHAEKLYSKKTPMMAHFRKRMGAGPDASMYDLIKATELPWDMHDPIVAHCREKALPFLSTPFELEAVDLLESYDVPAYKIAAFEMTHYPLIRYAAATGKPLILSTGMSNLGDIELALAAMAAEGNDKAILLHCVSNYPARPEDYNLRVIETLKAAFGCPVGLSDHTPGTKVAEVAIALGADLIEKHVTLDQTLPGPDHHFSLTAEQLTTLVNARDEIESMLGNPVKRCTEAETEMKRIGRRSLVAGKDIKKGQVVTEDDIEIKRPGSGIHPRLMDVVIGSRAQKNIEEDTPLDWDMFLEK